MIVLLAWLILRPWPIIRPWLIRLVHFSAEELSEVNDSRMTAHKISTAEVGCVGELQQASLRAVNRK
jgi:hypothetical protein